MKALIQRVTEASVKVDGEVVGEIDKGLLVFLGVEKKDTEVAIEKMAHKLLGYRVFSDNDNKMNLSVSDIEGDILLISQFTLAAQTGKGMRPGFSDAAPPDMAKKYYLKLEKMLKQRLERVETGIFAADMKVSLINDGPVTFMLEAGL